jgi:hypothetical protein
MAEPLFVHGIASYWRHVSVRLVPRAVGLPVGECWPVPVPGVEHPVRPVFAWWLTGMAPHA